MIARKLYKVNLNNRQNIFFNDIYLKPITMKKKKIILITEKQVKSLISKITSEAKRLRNTL